MTSPLCVDASVVLRLLVAAPGSEQVQRRWEEWRGAGRALLAPALLFYEVTNGLFRYERAGELIGEETQQCLATALALGIRRVDDPALHQEAAVVARELGLTATDDAHYLTLARRFGAEFWTADRRLYNRVAKTLPFVQLATA